MRLSFFPQLELPKSEILTADAKESLFKRYPDIDEGHPQVYVRCLIAVGLAGIGAVLPYWKRNALCDSTQLVALTALSWIGHGIVNYQFTARNCIEFHTHGYHNFHVRFLKTTDPTLNGIVSGIQNKCLGGFIFGGILTYFAQIPNFAQPIPTEKIAPHLGVLAAGALIYSQVSSIVFKKRFKIDSSQHQEELNNYFSGVIRPIEKGAYPVDLSKVPENKRIAWLGNLYRIQKINFIIFWGNIFILIGTVVTRIIKR